MKYLKLIILSFLIVAVITVKSQEINQSIKTGISLLNQPKGTIDNYLTKAGYSSYRIFNNIYDFRKETTVGIFEFTISYRNNRSNVISWSEHAVVIPSFTRELQELGFESVSSNTNTSIFGFKNDNKQLLASVIVRTQQNDFVISLSPIPNATKSPLPNTSRNTALLPDPKKAVLSKTKKYTTRLSVSKIIEYYRSFGAKSIEKNSFYLPFFESGTDSCIYVQITKKGEFNIIEFSMECD